MRTQTFKHDNATITVRSETIDDALDVDLMQYQMGRGTTAKESYKRRTFLRLVQLSTIEGDLGFEWPSPDASAEALLTAYEVWRKLPGYTIQFWMHALDSVNATPNDPDLTPAASEKKETNLTFETPETTS